MLTIASPKYGQVQVYNPLDESNGGGEFDAEYSDIVMGFCEDLTQNQISEILLKNISTIPLYSNK